VFDQLAQRKALQSELDEVRVHRGRSATSIGECSCRLRMGNGERQASWVKGPGPEAAVLLASKAVSCAPTPGSNRVSLGTENGPGTGLLEARPALASLRCVRGRSTVVLRRDDRPSSIRAGPPVKPKPIFWPPLAVRLRAIFLQAADPTGAALRTEMNEAYPASPHAGREFRDSSRPTLAPRAGLVYERWIEQHHGLPTPPRFPAPPWYFRLPSARPGRRGQSKVDYYLLNNYGYRHREVAVSLTIQSTAAWDDCLLARDKDLPKAQKDLGPFVGDTALQDSAAAARKAPRPVQVV